MPYGSTSRGLNGGGLLYQSLDIEASDNEYLSMSNANFIAGGDYNHAKLALIGAFKLESNGPGYLYCKHTTNSTDSEFIVFVGGDNKLACTLAQAAGVSATFTCSTVLSTGIWYAFMFHIDTAQASSSNRMKGWINNSAETASSYTAPTGAIPTNASAIQVGILNPSNPNNFDGKAHKLCLVSGVLPDAADVFNGTAGKLKNLAKLSGVHSLIDVRNGDVTRDRFLAAAWTNNNGVTASTEVP